MTQSNTPRTPEELLESMTGMFLPPSAMGEVNGLKVLCLQRENAALKAEVERLSKLMEDCLNVIRVYCPTYYNDAMERFNIATK